MSASVASVASKALWTPPEVKPFQEKVWQAWLAEGRAQERRGHALFLKCVKWMSIVALMAALSRWPHPGPYDTVVRFAVVLGALTMMSQALRSKYYVLAAVFGALVVVYNPVAPLAGFAGNWQSGLVVAAAIPFAASLAWRNPRMESNA